MVRKVTEAQARAAMARYADRVSAADVASAVGKEEVFRDLFRRVGKLGKHWESVKPAFAMLKDYVAGRYRTCPWRTVAVLVGMLAYVLSPVDLIPDFVPLVGWSDDGLVLVAALAFAKRDLEDYRAWKGER